MTETPRGEGGPVRPIVALGLSIAAFVALLICGLGMMSLLLDQDVLGVPGLGQVPGILGTAFTTAGFAVSLGLWLRRPHPSFWGAAVAALVCLLAYIFGVWFGAVLAGADLAAAAAAAGGVVTSWFGVVIAASGAICAWGGIALVRTRAQRPRWPWEDPFDE